MARADRFRGMLLVEDDVLLARAVCRVLPKVGPDHCRDAASARAKLAERSYALVLCDLNLGGGVPSGADLFAEIEADDPEQAARFVFLTGGAGEEFFHAFLRGVDNEVVEKPCERDELVDLAARFELTTD